MQRLLNLPAGALVCLLASVLQLLLPLLAGAADSVPVAAAGPADGVAAPNLFVKTRDGVVHGAVADGVLQFKGIPFAAPPVGRLRWEPPAPVTPWAGVLDATHYRAACAQARRFNLTEASDAEDCLHVNVAVPLAAASASRPVLVWFYGGAFVGGGTPLYALDYLSRAGNLVVVSVNYRLGPLGFMAHPAFGKDFNGGYALEDQRQALRWVQHNIAAFGGDPGNVTIGGVSAGAASVCMHLFTPERTRGLFHKAIVQSAGCTVPLRSVEEASRTGLAVAKIVGCDNPATALDCLRRVPAHDLVAAAMTVAGTDPFAFAPSVGSKALPRQGATALRTGEFVRVPIINGGTRDEMRVYVGYDVVAGAAVTPENYLERLRAIYGPNADAVQSVYPVTGYSSAPTALGSVMSDFMPHGALTNCAFLRTARLASKWVPVYQYEFSDPLAPPVMDDPGFEMGAVHTADMPYFFPGFSNTSIWNGPPLAPGSRQLAAQMVAYWSSFAYAGRPSAEGLPEWTAFGSKGEALRLEPAKVGMFDARAAHRCDFWEKLYPDELTP